MRYLFAACVACSFSVTGVANAQSTPAPAASASVGSIIGPRLYVTDMDKAIAFYRDMVGMKVRLQFGEPAKRDVMIGFGPDPSQPSILLLSDKTATPPRPVTHGHGFDRLVFFINDLPALSDRLRKGGFAPSEITEVHGMSMMMTVKDPDGYELELIGAKPRAKS